MLGVCCRSSPYASGAGYERSRPEPRVRLRFKYGIRLTVNVTSDERHLHRPNPAVLPGAEGSELGVAPAKIPHVGLLNIQLPEHEQIKYPHRVKNRAVAVRLHGWIYPVFFDGFFPR